MRVRAAWTEERKRRHSPSKVFIGQPKEGKPSTLILSADNDEEREYLHSLYLQVYEHLSSKAGKEIKPIPLQETMEASNENGS